MCYHQLELHLSVLNCSVINLCYCVLVLTAKSLVLRNIISVSCSDEVDEFAEK
jgi:hypothetical protein